MAQKRIKRTTAAAAPRIDLAAELAAQRPARSCMVCAAEPYLLEAIQAWRELPKDQQVSVCALWRVLERHGATFKRETLRNHLNDGH